MPDDEYMLTTTDNPWNPFINYDEWWAYDYYMGYHTPEYLARVCVLSYDLSDADQELAIQQAIDDIVETNALGIYRKIKENDEIKILTAPGGGP